MELMFMQSFGKISKKKLKWGDRHTGWWSGKPPIISWQKESISKYITSQSDIIYTYSLEIYCLVSAYIMFFVLMVIQTIGKLFFVKVCTCI